MVAASAPLGPDGWLDIRRASEMGVDDVTLSQEYGVTRAAIRKRREREGWITAQKLEDQVEAMRAKRSENTIASQVVTGGGKIAPKALEVAAKSLAERGDAYGLRVFDYASSAVQKAMDQGLLPTPDNWKTVAIADQMARRAAGLDKTSASANVSVNLAMFSSDTSEESRAWREVE